MTKTSTRTASNDTAPGSPVQEHRAALGALQAELQTVRVDADTARRNGETTQWMRLLQREADLPKEIEAARAIYLNAQLEEAWVTAEQCDATEQMAATNLAAASTAKAEFDQSNRPKNTTAEQVGASLHTAALLWDQLAAAKLAHTVARHAAEMALLDVETIEDAIEQATGKPPEGEGPRAPVGRLRVSFIAYHPAGYDPRRGDPRSQNADRLTFLAGTVPPRWAARQMTVPDAWEDSAQ